MHPLEILFPSVSLHSVAVLLYPSTVYISFSRITVRSQGRSNLPTAMECLNCVRPEMTNKARFCTIGHSDIQVKFFTYNAKVKFTKQNSNPMNVQPLWDVWEGNSYHKSTRAPVCWQHHCKCAQERENTVSLYHIKKEEWKDKHPFWPWKLKYIKYCLQRSWNKFASPKCSSSGISFKQQAVRARVLQHIYWVHT